MRPSTALVALLATALLTAAPTASAQPGVAAPIAPPSSGEGPPPPLAPAPKARPGAYRPVAASLLLTGIVYDLIGAPAAAARQNQRRWAATPTALASPRGALAPGLAVAGTF